MRSCSTFACTVLGAIAIAAIVSDARVVADSPKPEKQMRFLLLPTDSKEQLKAVPFGETLPIPKNGTLITCDSLTFSGDEIVFGNAILETEDQRTTATEATFVVSDASIRLSKDSRSSFKNAKGKQDLLKALSR